MSDILQPPCQIIFTSVPLPVRHEALAASLARSVLTRLTRAMQFIWREAGLLDCKDYRSWLALWSDEGHYVVPIDPLAKDFAATLNYAYDDRAMRELRVQRMLAGYSPSVSDAARTVRTVSRFTIDDQDAEDSCITVRSPKWSSPTSAASPRCSRPISSTASICRRTSRASCKR